MWATKHPCMDCGKVMVRRDCDRCRACYQAYREAKARLKNAKCATCHEVPVTREGNNCRSCYEKRQAAKQLECCLYTWEEYCFMRSWGIAHGDALTRLTKAFKVNEKTLIRRIKTALEHKGYNTKEPEQWPLSV